MLMNGPLPLILGSCLVRPYGQAGRIVIPARMKQQRDESGPTCLMCGTDAATGVAVEILVEEYVIAEVRIVLQHVVFTQYRPSSIGIAQE